MPGPTPVPVPVPAPPPVPEPCDRVGGPGGASIAPGSESERRGEALRRNVQLSDRIGLVLDLLHLELRRLRDRHGNFVLARQLGHARRLLHLVAAAAAAAARTGLAQPDDVAVRLIGQHRGRGRRAASRSGSARTTSRARARRCEISEPAKAGAMRFCGCSNRNGTSTGCAPSTWTDRCPADSFTRTSAVWLGSAIGKAMGLVEVLSRTGLSGCNCKRGASEPMRIC